MTKSTVLLGGFLAAIFITNIARAGDAEIAQQMQSPGGLVGTYQLTNDGNRCLKNINVKVLPNTSDKAHTLYELYVENADKDKDQQGYENEVNLLVVTNLSLSRKGGNDIDTEHYERSATATSISNSRTDGVILSFYAKEASLQLSRKSEQEILTYKMRGKNHNDTNDGKYDISCVYKRN